MSQPNLNHFMPENNQEKPLTSSTKLRKQLKGFQKSTFICGVIIIAVILLVLGFTIFHVKNPKIKMNSVTIKGLDQLNSTSQMMTNLTVVADVSLKNTNVAAFKFDKSNSSLVYRDTLIGVGNVPPGVAKARRTIRMNVTFDVMVVGVARNKMFLNDVATGILEVNSSTKINGRVKIMNIIKRHVTLSLNCSIAVNVTSWGIVNQDCKRHASI
ncbi:late embryogenesis abundant protein At1g64065-like [Rutidosis leptorrhynchoides]|uniref:late embryogenesis abundant protein At1g64065-like n=1 Tax=Rutidosis leptorrhynchoides TaxID=125765 RepID=UPI003A9A2657